MKTLITTCILLILTTSLLAQGKSIKDAKGLPVGAKAPLFEAVDGESNPIILQDLIDKGTVVLFFYRGVWCPYCNKHLYAIQEGLPQLYEKGIKVIAITPEKPEYISKMAEETNAKFTIVYDEDYSIAKAYDVNFNPEQKLINRYNKIMKANLEVAHENENPNLPIPATYIINKDGVITWRHFDPNYKKRASIEEIIEHLPN